MKINTPKYPAYKPSGVEWLGEIPEHWEVKPGFTLLYEAKEKNTGMKRTTVLSLSYGKIRIKETEELTGLVPESFETYQFVNKGDIIFRPTDLQNDHVSLRSGVSEFEGIITSAYLNLRFKPIVDNKFYSYFFRGIDNNKVIYGLGSGLRQNIDFRDFKRFLFPFPPLSEQTTIAAFLDHKTALIDQAIGIKEKQIELLKERRQILIHRAVTGKIPVKNGDKTNSVDVNENDGTGTVETRHALSLSPRTHKTKFKDSGVEWIGEIPEHWEVKRLKYVCVLQRGHDLSKDYFKEGSFPVYGSNGIIGYHNKLTTKAPSIVVGRSGSVGSVNFVLQDFWAHNTCLYVKESYGNDWRYLFNLLNIIDIKMIANGSAVPTLDRKNVHQVLIAFPSIQEQKNISEYIETVSEKNTTAISLKEQEIEKLKEYKASLIDAAVTGKIMVIKRT